ncbi:MAG TPA: esterase family protein [Candidatus Avipropionibacterium avicola]|uniref:Esterase family protein n=1 Tax=Candidatus Avipropionibacterium avicola TaxID=2840701 RepID=A0A9D1H0S7_9ACTN|nr:esterase family protein [Candidatus Avipropionibacterium avicola]
MLRMRCDFHSDALKLATSMTVLLPQRPSASQIGMASGFRPSGTPVLYLLHGLSDDDTIWGRRTSIERYVSELGLAVVMPQVHRSFYSDVVSGDGAYWSFIADELPQLVADSFQVSTRREDTFVAGLSMGGYGAFKLALHRPDRFAAAGSLSGVLDVAAMVTEDRRPEVTRTVWGDDGPEGTDDDLLHVLDRVDPTALPRLWTTCGTDDPLVANQRRFVEAAARRGIEVTADEHPGRHSWDFWDTHVQRFLEWLELG